MDKIVKKGEYKHRINDYLKICGVIYIEGLKRCGKT